MPRRIAAELARRFRLHHDTHPGLLECMAVVGAVAFPAFYAARQLADLPPRYDDWGVRAVATVLCLAAMLRRWWPQRLRPWFLPLAYLTLFQALAFAMPYTLLRNEAAPNTVVNMVVAAVLVMLLADWANAVLLLGAGYATALAAYWLLAPSPKLPAEFLAWWAPLCAVLVAGGSIARQVERRAELARLRRLYAAMAGSIAHEMRNPLAQVRHALDGLAERLGPAPGAPVALPAPQADAAREAVQHAQLAVGRGLQAIRMTLHQLQLGPSGPGATAPVSALACVQSAVRGYAWDDAAQCRRVSVHDHGDFLFEGDPAAIELVLQNLLKNALYYQPLQPGLAVRVLVEAEPVTCIRVEDNGPGIAPGLRARLFEEFETSGKREGTGLGLAFCRRVMRGLGGDIRCDSEPGRGATFILSFPRLPAGHGLRQAGRLLRAPVLPAGLVVLVVDDQAINRASVRARLSALGLRVVEAEHGPQAMALLAGGLCPDAILMDVNMPGPSGIDVTRSLRSLPGPVRATPVLALTADPSPGTIEEAREAGVQAVLDKPLDTDRLARELAPLLAAADAAPQRTQAADGLAPRPAQSPVLDATRFDELAGLGLEPGLLAESITRLGSMAARLSPDPPPEVLADQIHALLGLSAELGALALRDRLRAAYGPLRSEGRVPDPAWFDGLLALAQRTLAALRERLAAGAADRS